MADIEMARFVLHLSYFMLGCDLGFEILFFPETCDYWPGECFFPVTRFFSATKFDFLTIFNHFDFLIMLIVFRLTSLVES